MDAAKPRKDRSDDREDRTAPRRRRADSDTRADDESQSTPRRRKTTEHSTKPHTTKPRSKKDDRSGGTTARRRRSASDVDARHAAAAAAGYVRELTGTQPEGLTSLEHTDDGWRVGVEVLESRRIPDSTDILAEYRVDLDRGGDLVAYHRERRYHRGRVEGDQ